MFLWYSANSRYSLQPIIINQSLNFNSPGLKSNNQIKYNQIKCTMTKESRRGTFGRERGKCESVQSSVRPFCWFLYMYLTFAFFKQRIQHSVIYSFIHSLSFAQCVFIHAFVDFLTHVPEKLWANKVKLKQKNLCIPILIYI